MAEGPRFGRGAGLLPLARKKVPANRQALFGSFCKYGQKLFHQLFAVPDGIAACFSTGINHEAGLSSSTAVIEADVQRAAAIAAGQAEGTIAAPLAPAEHRAALISAEQSFDLLPFRFGTLIMEMDRFPLVFDIIQLVAVSHQ